MANLTPLFFVIGALMYWYPDAAAAVVAGVLLLRWLSSQR